MKKFITLLLVIFAMTGTTQAKVKVTTLWEGTDTGADIEVAKSKLVKGATLNLTFNWLKSEGAQFRCFWWNSSTSAWVYIKDWVWVNNGESYSFTLTDDEFDAITSDKLCFKTLTPDNMRFTKITQTETLVPTSTGDNLLTEDWVVEGDGWENRNFAAQTTAKIGDVIQFEITVAGGWKYTEVQVKDSEGSDLENTSKYVGNFAEETSATFEFGINSLNDLKKIESTGFRVNASNHATIKSIKLLSYADSYGYITVNIGDSGYATWSSTKNYDFATAGIQAYYASAIAPGTVTMTPMDITWNYQGYILKATKGGDYDVLESLNPDGSYYPNPNYLKSNTTEKSIAASTDGKYHYIFAWDKSNVSSVGFYKLTADHTLDANKAYLETDTDIAPAAAGGKRSVSLDFGDGTTAIFDVFQDETRQNTTQGDGCYYTLQGVRVEKPTKGLYILNGKKVLVK